jgi:hypothetical protein
MCLAACAEGPIRRQPDVRLHSEVPLVPLLTLLHVRVAFARLVLRRTGRGYQRGIDNRAALEQQALVAQQAVDRGEDLVDELVVLGGMQGEAQRTSGSGQIPSNALSFRTGFDLHLA